MTNSLILQGLQIVDPMVISGVIIFAGIPFAFTYLRRNGWQVSLGQMMLGTIPVGIFAYGFCNHIQHCEKQRLSETGYFQGVVDPVEHFLYMSLEHTNLFLNAFFVSTSVVWLMANLHSQTPVGAPQE